MYYIDTKSQLYYIRKMRNLDAYTQYMAQPDRTYKRLKMMSGELLRMLVQRGILTVISRRQANKIRAMGGIEIFEGVLE